MNLTTSSLNNLSNVSVSETGETIGFRFNTTIEPVEDTDYKITFNVGAEIFSLEFTAVPAT